MPEKKDNKSGRDEYYEKRREETKKTLLDGYRKLKKLNRYQNKPVSKYALSQFTGISRTTIDTHPEVLAILKKDADTINESPVKGVKLEVPNIKSFDEAVATAKLLSDLYNELKEKYNDLLNVKKNQDIPIAKMRLEIAELRKKTM